MKIQKLIVKPLTLCILFLLFGFSSFAQEDGVFFIKTVDGFLMVSNDSENRSFTIEFKGQKFEPIEMPESIALKIDGKFIQLVIVQHSKFLKADPKEQKLPTEKNILELHRDWESDYLSGVLQAKLDVKSAFTTVGNNQTAIFWNYAMPEKLNTNVTDQLYLTTVLGKSVLALNMPVERDTTVKNIQDYMSKSMATLKISQKPFDIKALSEELKQGKKP